MTDHPNNQNPFPRPARGEGEPNFYRMPMALAADSIRKCAAALEAAVPSPEQLAVDLAESSYACGANLEGVLATQAYVLDAVFNRLIADGAGEATVAKITAALKAQNQFRATTLAVRSLQYITEKRMK
jgi:hypothetical protein